MKDLMCSFFAHAQLCHCPKNLHSSFFPLLTDKETVICYNIIIIASVLNALQITFSHRSVK